MNELPIEHIAKLELAEGDALVITSTNRLPREDHASLVAAAKELGERMGIRNLPVAVIESGMELSVLKKIGPGPAVYDHLTDTLTVFDTKYSVELFRQLASAPIGSAFEIVGREDGTVTLRSIRDVSNG